MKNFAGIFLLLIFLFINCKDSNQTQNKNTMVEKTVEPMEKPLKANQLKITKNGFGENWAFTVNEGILECNKNEVTFVVDGKTYAVNGSAKKNKQYTPIDEIWAEDGTIKGTKKDISFTIEKGLDLCR